MRFLVCIILSLLLICCNRKVCSDSVYVNRDAYKRYLIILKESAHPKKLVMPKEIDEGIMYLEVVSGISSKAERSDVRIYRDKSDFKSDLKLWEQWYKNNKCKLTLHYVDSAFNAVKIK